MKENFINAMYEAFEIEAKEELDLETEFRNHDNWDSLTKLSLIAVLDDEFDIIIEDDKLETLNTFKDLLEFISNK
ncbi:MAG: acyl carrier protein [Flavobacterium sp.]|jgi:acyl carrier protein|nr:acyl carrier protein [Flavobacterium sp.]|tara:strand:- start:2701 stop:2925 length:225 start_codon:yes stop_codon:yes gene_type:complete